MLALSPVVPAGAATVAEPLHIKPGLWEIRLTVRSSGQPPMPPDVLAKLTAAERARIEAKAREREAAGPRITVQRKCLDERELEQPLALTFGGEGQGCSQTVVSASRNAQEIRVDCGKGGGTVRIEALDPENAQVVSDWTATDGTRTLKMTSAAALKWLGAACQPAKAAVPQETAKPSVAAKAPAPKSAEPAPPTVPAREDPGSYYKRGKEQTGRNDFWGAIKSLNQAIDLDPRNAAAYNARGYAYLRLRQFANAAVDFSDAIRLRPDYANAYQNRAIAERRLGDEKAAAADTQKAAELSSRR
jgi:hypothetical protein